jgi:hypothetical protein
MRPPIEDADSIHEFILSGDNLSIGDNYATWLSYRSCAAIGEKWQDIIKTEEHWYLDVTPEWAWQDYNIQSIQFYFAGIITQ